MLGFDLRLKTERNKSTCEKESEVITQNPVQSVVEVKFQDGRHYPYYNDKFDLKVGDVVFVDGKLYGKPGRVISVTTKFKISLEYYKKVLSVLDLSFHGTFKKTYGFMVSDDSTLSFEQVKNWYLPPEEEEEEFIFGEGESFVLGQYESFNADALSGGEELLDDDRVAFISFKDGIGHAVIEGGKSPHIVDFKLKDGVLSDVYCDCITPCSCKHIAAVVIILSFIYEKKVLDMNKNFIILTQKLFFSTFSYNNDKITL